MKAGSSPDAHRHPHVRLVWHWGSMKLTRCRPSHVDVAYSSCSSPRARTVMSAPPRAAQAAWASTHVLLVKNRRTQYGLLAEAGAQPAGHPKLRYEPG